MAVFSPTGQHLHDITGDWTVVHSLVLYEAEDVLCVADREGEKIDCLGAGLRLPQFRGSVSSSIKDLGRVYGLAGRGTALVAVGWKGDWTTRGTTEVTSYLSLLTLQSLHTISGHFLTPKSLYPLPLLGLLLNLMNTPP